MLIDILNHQCVFILFSSRLFSVFLCDCFDHIVSPAFSFDLLEQVAFKKEVEQRGGEFKNTVFSFSEVEGNEFTLTRWLRARKYDLADTIKMVEEAMEERAVPRGVGYYPNPVKALGVDPSIFVSQYPQLYSGFSKCGCPVFYSKPGALNIDGIECITTLDGILKYHWHVMQHDYKQRLLEFKKENPSFTRFECVSILDLSGLAVSALNSRTLDVVKKQATIDSLCFPETMNKMLVLNAPRFFSATWSIIKGFVDVRTAGKIEVISSSSAAEKKLKEIIDVDQLPEDYGGTGESTLVTLAREAGKEAANGGRSRLIAEVMYVRGSLSFKFILKADEEADLWVHTRAKSGATFTVTDTSTKKPIIPTKTVIHSGGTDDNSQPSNVQLSADRISGPDDNVMEIKVKAEGLKTRMTSETYLLVANIYKKK
jgi:hypothetical protein